MAKVLDVQWNIQSDLQTMAGIWSEGRLICPMRFFFVIGLPRSVEMFNRNRILHRRYFVKLSFLVCFVHCDIIGVSNSFFVRMSEFGPSA